MADAAARREARRRRILENSEYRLQRIAGHVNNDDSTEERNKKTTGDQSTVASSIPNGIVPNEAIMQDQSFDSLINEINANIDADEPSMNSEQIYTATQELLNRVISGQNIILERNPERSYISNEYGNVESLNSNNSNNLRFLHDREESHVGSTLDASDRDIATPNSPLPEQSSLLNNILSSRLVYVTLAIVVNIMLVFKLEHIIGASIIVPFLMVMIGRLCMYKNNEVAESNNILVAALILSNCRPDFVKIILRLKGTFTLFGEICRDLAIYIFSFVLFYTIISQIHNRDDYSSLQHETEAIFSDDIAM